ncbi:hypothetical protein LX32DRAFT_696075 [Colletotrichum zoysiae]|uniref:Uncharacterized protein n=1 Tax=Colletotrichum zoysiae TaxID=1216348 RepID=A0AAD9HCJ0_9PEZI|nr:hypothetical protein LX32DRAFT_696075 [Colletotrichum zoysiae]
MAEPTDGAERAFRALFALNAARFEAGDEDAIDKMCMALDKLGMADTSSSIEDESMISKLASPAKALTEEEAQKALDEATALWPSIRDISAEPLNAEGMAKVSCCLAQNKLRLVLSYNMIRPFLCTTILLDPTGSKMRSLDGEHFISFLESVMKNVKATYGGFLDKEHSTAPPNSIALYPLILTIIEDLDDLIRHQEVAMGVLGHAARKRYCLGNTAEFAMMSLGKALDSLLNPHDISDRKLYLDAVYRAILRKVRRDVVAGPLKAAHKLYDELCEVKALIEKKGPDAIEAHIQNWRDSFASKGDDKQKEG